MKIPQDKEIDTVEKVENLADHSVHNFVCVPEYRREIFVRLAGAAAVG